MEAIFSFLKVVAICGTALAVVFIVLLAMPKSQLRSIVLEIVGWTGAAGSAAMVVSPIDLVPDFVPVLGQMDDVGYIVCGIALAIFAYLQRGARRSLASGSSHPAP